MKVTICMSYGDERYILSLVHDDNMHFMSRFLRIINIFYLLLLILFNIFYVLLVITINILCPACYSDKYILSHAWCLYLVFQPLLLVPHPCSRITI